MYQEGLNFLASIEVRRWSTTIPSHVLLYYYRLSAMKQFSPTTGSSMDEALLFASMNRCKTATAQNQSKKPFRRKEEHVYLRYDQSDGFGQAYNRRRGYRAHDCARRSFCNS